MKIGIMTMHRVYNYGSFLQAYALKTIIEKLGHEVVFVDYKVEKPIIHNKTELISYYKEVMKKLIFGFLDNNPIVLKTKLLPEQIRYSAISHNRYQNVYWKYLNITKHKEYRTNVDVLVIGSDEVFNCLQANVDVGYSRELYGFGSNASKIITYAASFGNTTLNKLKAEGIDEKIKDDFKRIQFFSVRDKNTYDIVRSLTGRNDIEENLDPVLIHDFSELASGTVAIDNYIIVYAYRGRLSEKEEKAIREFANNRNKKIVCIGGYHSFGDIYIQDSPLDIFKYFKHADYVITDTFHGTIFSIINHANVGVFIRDSHGKTYGNCEKMLDLLKRLGLESRIIQNTNQLESVLDSRIDYNKVDSIIKIERKKALDYLSRNL